MSTSEKIATAYGVLLAQGQKPTVRAVQAQSGVRIGEVAAWLRENATTESADVPEPPELTEVATTLVRSLWAAAWTNAAQAADATAAELVETAREGEAQALELARTAERERDSAAAEQERATTEAATLRSKVTELRHQLDTAQREADRAREEATRSDRARVRAEATSDTLREIVDALRNEPRKDDEESGGRSEKS